MSEIQNIEKLLNEAKIAVEKEEKLSLEISNLKKDLDIKNKTILDDEKNLKKEIETNINNKLEQLIKSYDLEHNNLLEKIKKINQKREKSKNKGIKERIEEETKQLRTENNNIKAKIKDELKNNSMPFYSAKHFFISLTMPGNIKEFFTLVLTFLIVFALIPILAFLFIPWKFNDILKLIIIYIIDIFLFISIYITFFNNIKNKFKENLKTIKKYKKDISLNKKEIAKIANNIKKDSSEEAYNLSKFDDEISYLNKEIEELIKQRQQAKQNFESVTQHIIIDEINANNLPRINSLKEEKSQCENKLKMLELLQKENNLKISNEYAVYLDKEFLEISKLDELLSLAKENNINNINELIEKYRTRVEA